MAYLTIPTSVDTGALLGKALSKQIGAGAATGEDINQSIRAGLIQTGVAEGKVDPGTLSSSDAALLAQANTTGIQIRPPKAPGGGGLLHILGVPLKIAENTAGDFLGAVESLPSGIAALGKGTAKEFAESDFGRPFGLNSKSISGPDLLNIAKAVGGQTVRDVTHFDPMHPLYPALDIAALASGGASALARGGGALSRLAAGARAAETGGEASLAARTLGRLPGVQAAGGVGQRLARLSTLERPALPINPRTEDVARSGINVPEIQRYYSTSPFRQLFVERPIDRLLGTHVANVPLPFLPEKTSLADVRTNYLIRRQSNVLGGRASSTSINNTVRATHGFNEAMHSLLRESPNETVANEKFDALVLQRMLGAEHKTAQERVAILDEYRDRILKPHEPVEGIPRTKEGDEIRKFRLALTESPEYRRVFAEPTAGMLTVKHEWDKAIHQGLMSLNLDPNELLHRSLGPAAFIRDLSPEELLREQPELIQRSMSFAMRAHEIEKGVVAEKGNFAPEEGLDHKLSELIPGEARPDGKLSLVRDAIESLKADISGEFSRRDLLNNAHSTQYLPGNTLAQKIAMGMEHKLGVAPEIAEKFATGGLTNYFPSVSALQGMKVRNVENRITRNMRQLTGRERPGMGQHIGEYRRENLSRLLKANALGVAPFASFLKDADLTLFKAGIDRRDPIVLIRHISQRERLLTHRLLAAPMIERLSLKGRDGLPMRFNSQEDLLNQLGSTVAAEKWRLLPPQALQTLVQTEDGAALDVAKALREEGTLTPELMDRLDQVVNESAQGYVRQLGDDAVNSKGMVAVPTTYVNNLIKQAKVLDSARGAGHLWQAFINKWRTAVLAYMPSWLLRTSVGHGMVLFLSGVWNPTHYVQATNYFRDGFKIPGTDIHLSRGLNREVPAGIQQGMPHADFGQIGARNALHMNKMAEFTTHGVHSIANFQRRAGFLASLNRITKQHFAELGEAFKVPGGFRDARNIDDIIQNHPDLVHHALNELDRVSYTFGQMAPWERRLAKNIMPFWGWYKFVTKFVWSLPFTYPGRALAITRLGQVGASEQDQLGPMPDWLRASVMFNTHNLAAVHYISTLGLNPLGDVANPAQGFQGLIRLGQMSPIIQSALEGAGYNTMTGGLENIDPASGIIEVNGRYINTKTGKEYDSLDQASVAADLERFFGGLLRSFPEIRIGELAATGGHPIYPESVPFVYERPIPGAQTKSVSPQNILLQYGGVAPKTYNLQKYQLNLLKDYRRALGAQRKGVAKERVAAGQP